MSMFINQQTRMMILMNAVSWGMSWANAEQQLDDFLNGDYSINTAQIQNVINRLGFKNGN